MRVGGDREGGHDPRMKLATVLPVGEFCSTSEKQTTALWASTSPTTYRLEFKTPECHKANIDRRSVTLSSL